MATRHQTRRPSRDRPAESAARTAQNLERAAASLALALVVARPLFPSEDADQGTGLVLVAMWGVVALLWAAAQLVRGELRWHASSVDFWVLVLLGLVLLSAFWADTQRPAINMACEWTGLILSYFLTRQLARGSATQRALVVVMMATAFALAVLGMYQLFGGLEPDRERYASNRLLILQELRITPGSPQEELFKNRLMSHEPFATFALANSLAGFLVTWLPLGLAWLLELALVGREREIGNQTKPQPAGRPGDASSVRHPSSAFTLVSLLLFAVAAVLLPFICLVMTQSRTAYVGFLVACILLAMIYGKPVLQTVWQRASRPMLVGSLLIALSCVAGILVLAVHRGKIDEKLFTQAKMSLGFRWQYWQATARLIRDHFWLGVGPGNFRGHYLKYKLAESSEEIAEPHNMVLELCATSGVLAGVAFLSTLVMGLGRMSRSTATRDTPAEGKHWMLLAGGGMGWLLGGLHSPLDESKLFALAAAWLGAVVVFETAAPLVWVRPRVVACAIFGLAVHLLGAGGIGMPSVSQSLWVLLALGLNAAECDGSPWSLRGKRVSGGVAMGVMAGLVFFGIGVLRPVTGSQSAFSLGRRLLDVQDWAGAESQFLAAAEWDPLSTEPWIELARIHYEQWRQGRGRSAEEQFESAVRSLARAHKLAPSRLEPCSLMGALLEARAQRTQDPPQWRRAAEAYQQCLQTYPTSAELWARLARSLWQAEASEAAKTAMRQALELDSKTPHLDKKLSVSDREFIEQKLRGDEAGKH